MASTYSFHDGGSAHAFRDNGGGLGEYVEKTAERTGLSKADILRQCVRLARASALFEGTREEVQSMVKNNGQRRSVENGADMDAPNMVDADADNPSKSGAGIRAADLAQMEAAPSGPGDDDAPQQGDSRSDGDAQDSSEKWWQGW